MGNYREELTAPYIPNYAWKSNAVKLTTKLNNSFVSNDIVWRVY